MSEEKKPFSVNIPEDDFVNDIPAPESDVPAEQKPHKVVRYVEAPKAEEPKKAEKKKEKKSFVGEFLAGAAAGAKTVGEGISAGAKVVAEKKPKAEKPAPRKETKTVKEDETQFPKDEKKKASNGGIMAKLNSLPVGAVVGGAAAVLVALIAIILICATSCSAEDTPTEQNGPSGSDIVIGAPEDEEEEVDLHLEVPTRKDKFVEAFNANNDVIGWLYVPGLEDVDAGVCFSTDKSYPYDKRDITGKKVPNSYWIDGAYYTHFRGFFGDTTEELSLNTVIFGHSDLGLTNLSYANDDPTGPLFSQLFNFKDPSFAEKTPYIYLTLPGEETVWEVFSVFYNDAKAENSNFTTWYKKNGGSLWYIEPNPAEEEYAAMLERIQARSIYDYDVEVTAEDQILTLSTCTVAYGLNARSNYRFVVVAKLVEDPANEHISKNASFTIKEDAPIPDTYKTEFEGYLSSWEPSETIQYNAESIEGPTVPADSVKTEAPADEG